ncbi:APC family permease [Cellulomonas bogoriensis]|uniref:DNA-binding protein n=1 Tax=Cellulomonas bogoriensis 69B4 = DSM 16987 TaxID=1386082 RepID=A0A0A0C0Z2_9CELL|nr:APC family permease [Cellulomonas bogoriensis]KGM14288.1 DNA-binding protein [Cellulomonas bogoriensis 69B4 = DSM 16987]
MSDVVDAAKRLLLGRPVRSEHQRRALLPKRLALPTFASDALSSLAYAPDEILLALSIAGLSALLISPWVGLAVAVVLAVVIASYRQNVRAYPSGGGDYEIATTNLGPRAGLGVGSALLVDYALTVAVSVSSAAQYVVVLVPALAGRETEFAIVLVLILTLAGLRGLQRRSPWLVVPVYLFMGALGATAVVGAVRYATGTLPVAASGQLDVVPLDAVDQGLMGLAGALIVLRAFTSGCAALTGVESVATGVGSFRRPRGANAAATLALLGILSITFLMSILLLAQAAGVRYVADPARQLLAAGEPVGEGYVQHPVLGQLAEVVFSGFAPAVVVTVAATALVLVLAAASAFTQFPTLGSILARDGYLPRQLHTRGDRLVFSNGILTLAAGAIVLVWSLDASVTRLIQLYIVGVFVSFTLSQAGMVAHWNRHLRTEPDPRTRVGMLRSRVVSTVGLALTGTVLVVVLVTRFTLGAWITVVLMGLLFVVMTGIRRHYDQVHDELALGPEPAASRALPSRVHAIVLVSRLHKPTMRAIAYARAARPSVLEAVTVSVDPEELAELRQQWEQLDLPLTLKVLDSAYRDLTRPVLGYVRSIRRESPRDLVVVYVPEYVVGHWWERLLHNQSASRLRSRLLLTPGVVVASVPWRLRSSVEVDGPVTTPPPPDPHVTPPPEDDPDDR